MLPPLPTAIADVDGVTLVRDQRFPASWQTRARCADVRIVATGGAGLLDARIG